MVEFHQHRMQCCTCWHSTDFGFLDCEPTREGSHHQTAALTQLGSLTPQNEQDRWVQRHEAIWFMLSSLASALLKRHRFPGEKGKNWESCTEPQRPVLLSTFHQHGQEAPGCTTGHRCSPGFNLSLCSHPAFPGVNRPAGICPSRASYGAQFGVAPQAWLPSARKARSKPTGLCILCWGPQWAAGRAQSSWQQAGRELCR